MRIENMRLLSIDDNKTNLLIVESYAKMLQLNIDSFLDPKEALEKTQTQEYDLVIVDFMMPDINGLEFIELFRKTNQETPIIMLTAVGDDMKLQIDALQLGANDFLSKPINAPAFKARIINMLKLRKAQLLIKDKALLLQEEVEQATKRLKESEQETLQMLGKTSEYKDPETNAHTLRVAHYSKLLAHAYGMDKEFQEVVFYASPFHDIGKIGIPDKILLKPGKLNEDEFAIMKKHSSIGYEILKGSKSKYLKAGGVIAYNHHEKYDGTGYPNGLKGESIPILGRITAIADVFDALTSTRPYKEAWSIEQAFELLEEEKGKHFDPILVELFLQQKQKVIEIYYEFKEEETK
ncbi:MAG: HD domain-containing phosphohydrolase [Arcobacteraceae bacterium]